MRNEAAKVPLSAKIFTLFLNLSWNDTIVLSAQMQPVRYFRHLYFV